MFENQFIKRNLHYYCIDSPRNRSLFWLRNFFAPIKEDKTLILLYHRVVDDNFQGGLERLFITKNNFEKQLDFLQENYPIISLEEYNHLKNNKKQVIITFDDGYRDLYTYALPALQQRNIPATVFITTSIIDNMGDYFWWDILELLIFNNERKEVMLEELGNYTLNSLEERRTVYDTVLKKYKKLESHEANKTIEKIFARYGKLKEEMKELYLNREDIHEMLKNKISFGSHTREHTILSGIDDEQAIAEIGGSKKELEKIVQKEVNLFSYPNGVRKDFLQRDVDIVKKSGYRYACSSLYGTNDSKTNPHILKRVQVSNHWSIDEFRSSVERAFLLS
ncbi:MAG: polysaccharide deacetylase family protein [Nitrospinae bacterium]|nr:polysaccharide deacetylase family protein [Nitrospinota bacterium]